MKFEQLIYWKQTLNLFRFSKFSKKESELRRFARRRWKKLWFDLTLFTYTFGPHIYVGTSSPYSTAHYIKYVRYYVKKRKVHIIMKIEFKWFNIWKKLQVFPILFFLIDFRWLLLIIQRKYIDNFPCIHLLNWILLCFFPHLYFWKKLYTLFGYHLDHCVRSLLRAVFSSLTNDQRS